MSTKVKICGLTSKEDAIWALNFGADYLGLNFYKGSPRHLTVASAAWAQELPPFAHLVGVVVDPTIQELLNIVKSMPLKAIQFHGSETPEFIRDARFQWEGLSKRLFVVKAIQIEDESSLARMNAYVDVADYFLLDAYAPDQKGGTGRVFNWDFAVKAKELKKPIFLAGGLTPENVTEAVHKVQPFAVDVSSGVEKSPRKKDSEKMKNFIHHAKKEN